jgi:ligand-binding SRPBCC domain-containing protein
MTTTACIDAPANEVWAVLSRLDAIQLWVRSIEHSHCPGQSRGVGALRVCELKQATIRETFLEWEEGRSFTYQGEGAPMMQRAINRWSVEAQGNRTLVTSSAEVVVKGGVFGRLLEPLLGLVFVRLGARSMASLKYLVEHGEPFSGSARNLVAAPIAC